MLNFHGFQERILTKEVGGIYSERVSQIKEQFSQNSYDILVGNPRYILFLLAKIQQNKNPDTININSFLDGTFGGNFSGYSQLNIKNGYVILLRLADSYEHLLKIGQQSAGTIDLYNTSVHNGGGNGVPTSAFHSWDTQFGTTKKVFGTFKIPVNDLISIFQNGKAILGNIGEGEIVLSPEVAQKYLSSYEFRNNSGGYVGLPGEITINF